MKIVLIFTLSLFVSGVVFADSFKATQDQRDMIYKLSKKCMKNLKCKEVKGDDDVVTSAIAKWSGVKRTSYSKNTGTSSVTEELKDCSGFQSKKNEVCRSIIVDKCQDSEDDDCKIDAIDTINRFVTEAYAPIEESQIEYRFLEYNQSFETPFKRTDGNGKNAFIQSCVNPLEEALKAYEDFIANNPPDPKAADKAAEEKRIKKAATLKLIQKLDETHNGYLKIVAGQASLENPIAYGENSKLVASDVFGFHDERLLSLDGCQNYFGPDFNKSLTFEPNHAKAMCDFSAIDKCSDLISSNKVSSTEFRTNLADEDIAKFKPNTEALRKCLAGESDIVSKEKIIKDANHLVLSCYSVNRLNKRLMEKNGDKPIHATTDVPQQRAQDGTMQVGMPMRGGFICMQTLGLTLDYRPCKNAADLYDAGIMGDMLGNTGNQVYGAIANQNINTEMMQNSAANATKKGGAQDASLKAAQDRMDVQKNQEIVKSGIEGTKGIWGAGQILAYTKPKTLVEDWCNEGDDNRYDLSRLDACTLSALYAKDESSYQFEDGRTFQQALFRNKDAVDAMSRNAGQNISKSLISGLVAGMLGAQGDMIGEVRDKWNQANFNNSDTQIEYEGYCQQYPTAPACREGSDGLISGGGVDFQFNNNAAGPNQIGYTNDNELGEFEGADGDKLSGEQIDNLNDIMGGGPDDRGVAGITKKVGAAVGGTKRGASGGGAGGAGGGGGGGGGPSGKRGAAGGSGMKKLPKAKYTVGQFGKFATGRSLRKKGKGGSKNPFSGLMGKRNRGIASNMPKNLLPKNIRLFTAISKKYDQVNKDGRLEKVK